MIAKFDGLCTVTGQRIIAGVTEIVRRDGVWQCANVDPAMAQRVAGDEQIAAYSAINAERQERRTACPDCGRGMTVERIPGGGVSCYCEYCEG